MSEYLHVEKTFLDQLAGLGWVVIDQGVGVIPSDPSKSLRGSFREWLLPEIFRNAVRTINTTDDGQMWLGGLSDLRCDGRRGAPSQCRSTDYDDQEWSEHETLLTAKYAERQGCQSNAPARNRAMRSA